MPKQKKTVLFAKENVINEGWLRKSPPRKNVNNPRSWKCRFFRLLKLDKDVYVSLIKVCKKKNEAQDYAFLEELPSVYCVAYWSSENKHEDPIRVISLKDCSVRKEDNWLNEKFHHKILLTTNMRKFFLCAQSQHEKEEWFRALNISISQQSQPIYDDIYSHTDLATEFNLRCKSNDSNECGYAMDGRCPTESNCLFWTLKNQQMKRDSGIYESPLSSRNSSSASSTMSPPPYQNVPWSQNINNVQQSIDKGKTGVPDYQPLDWTSQPLPPLNYQPVCHFGPSKENLVEHRHASTTIAVQETKSLLAESPRDDTYYHVVEKQSNSVVCDETFNSKGRTTTVETLCNSKNSYKSHYEVSAIENIGESCYDVPPSVPPKKRQSLAIDTPESFFETKHSKSQTFPASDTKIKKPTGSEFSREISLGNVKIKAPNNTRIEILNNKVSVYTKSRNTSFHLKSVSETLRQVIFGRVEIQFILGESQLDVCDDVLKVTNTAGGYSVEVQFENNLNLSGKNSLSVFV